MRNSGIFAVMLTNSISWIATGAVAAVAINTTGNAWWSLLLLIPALSGYNYREGDSK